MSSYANARNLLAKSVEELAGLRENGLELLYLGLESGDDQTLADIHKGMTVAEQIEGCRRASEAGIELSVTAILGLAGIARSREHGKATGEALSAIDPQYIGILTLMLTPGTAMDRKVASGELVLPDSIGMLRELREIVANLERHRLPLPQQPRLQLPAGGRTPAAGQGGDARRARQGAAGARVGAAAPGELAAALTPVDSRGLRCRADASRSRA